jgi:hypothetical protein
MTSQIADGVMAATYKLVQQAMTGQWQDVPKTIAERRVLLNELSASATPQDQQWLQALKQAMAESDAAVAKMSEANIGSRESGIGSGIAARDVPMAPGVSSVDSMIDMIRGSR